VIEKRSGRERVRLPAVARVEAWVLGNYHGSEYGVNCGRLAVECLLRPPPFFHLFIVRVG
jgi:hypothetical protein